MNHLLKVGIVKCEWIKNLSPSGADIHQTVQFSGSNLSSRPAVIRRRTIFCVLHHSLFPHSFGERFNPKSVKHQDLGLMGTTASVRLVREEQDSASAGAGRTWRSWLQHQVDVYFFITKASKKKGDYFLLFCHSRCSLDLRQSLDSY